jgi:hypothetical protein
MTEKSSEQAYMEILLVEMQKFSAIVSKLEALVPRIENAIIDQIANCREDMSAVYHRLGDLEQIAACKKGRDSMVEKSWFRNPHWWHNAAVWVGLITALFFSTRGLH